MEQEQRPRRAIRSYVLRQGRTTAAQARAFDQHWAQLGLPYRGATCDLDAAFGRRAPIVVEIGFGNGEQLLHAALAEPDRNHLGIEVHRPGVGRLLNAAAGAGVNNLRVYRHDAVEVFRHEIAAESVAEVRLYFPDPWPKKRQQKRRLVQPALVDLLASRLLPAGVLHLATDWQPYAEHMLSVCSNCPDLRNLSPTGDWIERPAWRRQTHFEQRGLRLGHGVRDLCFARR